MIAPPAQVEEWAVRLARNSLALPSYSLANSAPQAYADDACRQIEAAIAKHGGSPRLYRSLALVQIARGAYAEAADYAKLSDQKEALGSRIRGMQTAAAAIEGTVKSEAVLAVTRLRNKHRPNLWSALLGARISSETASPVEGSRPVAKRFAVYAIDGGKPIPMASHNIKRELSETTLYAVDLDGDGNEEAVAACLFYGASWTPSTFLIASAGKPGWRFSETALFEEPGFIEDADKDGVFEVGGAQCIGDIERLSHAGQPRYPVVFRFAKGRLANGDVHVKRAFREILPELRLAHKRSPGDLELLSCEARALRVLGRGKEAAALAKARAIDRKKADRIWNGAAPWSVFRSE